MYYLSNHVSMCAGMNHYVLLDTKLDRYFCVKRQALELLSPWLSGWQGSATHPTTEGLAREAVPIAQSLLDMGILCRSLENAKPVRPDEIAIPTSSLDQNILVAPITSKLSRYLSFRAACRAADTQLRTVQLQIILRNVQKTKAEHENDARPDLLTVASLVQTFCELRPFFSRPLPVPVRLPCTPGISTP